MTYENMIKTYGRCTGCGNLLFPPVICMDGTFISAQAGYGYSSYPAEFIEDNSYEEVEVRTEATDTELEDYRCDDTSQYGYVPVEVLNEVINNHGGIDTGAINNYLENNN